MSLVEGRLYIYIPIIIVSLLVLILSLMIINIINNAIIEGEIYRNKCDNMNGSLDVCPPYSLCSNGEYYCNFQNGSYIIMDGDEE